MYTSIAGSAIAYSPLLVGPFGNAIYVTPGGVGFNGYDLNNGTTIICQDIDVDDLTKVDLSSFDYSQTNGGGVLSKYYRGRQIRLSLFLKATTPALLDALIDDVKKNTKATEGIFSFRVADGTTRIIPATVTGIKYDRNHYNVTFIKAEMTLQCAQAFFESVDGQAAGFEGILGNYNDEVTHAGTATSDPTVYMVFASGSGVSVSFQVGGRMITPASTFSGGDILVINCASKAVLKNDVSIDYSGAFPELEPWVSPFFVTAPWASYDLTIIIPKTYL